MPRKRKLDHPVFERGFEAVRAKIEKFPKPYMSCFNCNWYYQAVGDKEEVCQNPNVLKYDMVVADGRVYCLKWIVFQDKVSRSDIDAKDY